jgi:predicted DNA repair protein MutK
MASGLLALLDDIAALMDDTAVMTKVAAKKTAGIVGDDLAVNAEAMVGINPKRELAIVAQVAKGSVINKAMLIPGALVLAAVAPWLIPIILMLGGAFLCYEAWHKTFGHAETAHQAELVEAAHASTEATLAVERQKIKQAVTTDLILSAEIIAIALGSMPEATLTTQALSLVVIAIGMTVIVYGSVAGLVKLDDLGLWLMKKPAALWRKTGRGLVLSVPYIMKALSIIGTAAMFMVGGGIILHGIPLGHAFDAWVATLPGLAATILGLAAPLAAGAIVGFLCALVWHRLEPAVKALWARVRG